MKRIEQNSDEAAALDKLRSKWEESLWNFGSTAGSKDAELNDSG